MKKKVNRLCCLNPISNISPQIFQISTFTKCVFPIIRKKKIAERFQLDSKFLNTRQQKYSQLTYKLKILIIKLV